MNIMKNIKQKITDAGVENCLFLLNARPLRKVLFINYTSSSDDEHNNIPYKVVQKRYKLKDNYKIELEPLHIGYPKKIFYISDLNAIVNSGQINFFIKGVN